MEGWSIIVLQFVSLFDKHKVGVLTRAEAHFRKE